MDRLRRWLRTCQSCGHTNHYPPPSESYYTDEKVAWKYGDVECKKCHSESLDLGSYETFPDKFETECEDEQ